jgi:ubiquinone/menaquinone biosynthesis C-methylase UbiE
MIRSVSHAEVLTKYIDFRSKVVIDVGCGMGDFTRWLASQSASVIGIDVPEMIRKADMIEKVGNERFIAGTGQNLPFEKKYADLIVYIASFHHTPENEMFHALVQCHKILKDGGTAIFIEPVAQKGSYYEIVRLEGDEAEIQGKVYKILQDANQFGFTIRAEEIYFLERSFADYEKLIRDLVDDDTRKSQIIADARIITSELCQESNVSFDAFRYRSICRLNILDKIT